MSVTPCGWKHPDRSDLFCEREVHMATLLSRPLPRYPRGRVLRR